MSPAITRRLLTVAEYHRIRELVVPEKDLPFEPLNLTIPAELLWKLI